MCSSTPLAFIALATASGGVAHGQDEGAAGEPNEVCRFDLRDLVVTSWDELSVTLFFFRYESDVCSMLHFKPLNFHVK